MVSKSQKFDRSASDTLEIHKSWIDEDLKAVVEDLPERLKPLPRFPEKI